MVVWYSMKSHEDTQADLEIKSCIDRKKSFTVIAGAGSGKTGSLVKALSYVRYKHGKILRAAGQQVACITYTNAAVDIIKQRTDLDELYAVSTIHSFLWGLVSSYQKDIRVTLKEELIPLRISKKKEEDKGGSSKTAIRAREKVAVLSADLENISKVDHFIYDDRGSRNYSAGRLDHDDIIDLVSMMIFRFPMLRNIISQKHPYIFIDEAQDTFCNVLNAFNLISQEAGFPILGYFGDPMQQIYDDNRAGEFKGPEGAITITKVENYRCSTEVINLLNVIRRTLQQVPGVKNVTGSVEIRLIKTDAGAGLRNTYTDDQLSMVLKKYDEALSYFKWSEKDGVKLLFLTRQMIARRIGFSSLNRLFTGEYASKNAEDSFKEGRYFVLQPFMDVLVPLVEAHAKSDQIAILQILRENSPLLDPEGNNKSRTIKDIASLATLAIEAIVGIWKTSSIKEILLRAKADGLINISERLAEQLSRSPRTEIYDEDIFEKEKSDWLIDELMKSKTNELLSYRNFILELTPYNTQHGVKGDEFEKVLVVFDDTEANWSKFSFARLFTPKTAGKDPSDGQKQKSMNLAYVCFSRAIRDLRIILFTTDPSKAQSEIIDQNLFKKTQISIQE